MPDISAAFHLGRSLETELCRVVLDDGRRLEVPVPAGWRLVRKRYDEARCGTDAGYYRHRRVRHEEACGECLDAHAAAERANDRERRRRRRRREGLAGAI